MAALLEWIANLIYPPKCVFCGKILRSCALLHICTDCHARLPFSKEEPMPAAEDGETAFCDGVISVLMYTGMVRESLIRFKFRNRPGYYRTFARLLARRLEKLTDTGGFDMVMGVPLHMRRELERGFNQAYLLSKALSRELGLPEASGLLKRRKDTRAQSLLDKRGRQENIRGAFSVTDPGRLRGKSVILVDDILTTGSTLEECGRALKTAGAAKVVAAVVATGRKY